MGYIHKGRSFNQNMQYVVGEGEEVVETGPGGTLG